MHLLAFICIRHSGGGAVSPRRLVLTGIVMAAAAFLLGRLTPDPASLLGVLRNPQQTVDVAGADALLVAVTGLAAWGIWAWGALGLLLTAASAVPGTVGAAAGSLLRGLLPAAARHGAALALGVGVALPVLLAPPGGGARPVLVAGVSETTVPDWPAEQSDEAHVVVRGDCLWDIAAGRLVAPGPGPTNAEIAAAVQAWWSANADVIGPDPDLILPGQVLRPPP
jgi:hypothetical protein